jgi:CRP-like cAMP-binding protein
MPVAPSALRKIPLFANITDQHLSELIAVFRKRNADSGELLFQAGSLPDRFLILIGGEVSLREGDEERFRLRPIAPIGELGALTRIERRLSAVAATPSELLELSVEELMQFFEEHGDVAFPFHYNLLRVVADKIRRDRRRLEEMRSNLMTTQKSLKRMREALLEGEDTPLNKQLFDEIETLIAQNKKGRYLAQPAEALRTQVRLDDKSVVDVSSISKEWLYLPARAASKAGAHWSGVLILPERELAVSGTVDSVNGEHCAIKLDLLIDESTRVFEDHLTRLQMLDVVL